MKASRLKFMTGALVATLTLSAVLVAMPAARSRLEAQVQGQQCVTDDQGGAYCVKCDPLTFAGFGCSQPPPGVYRLGVCGLTGVVCYRYVNFDCGVQIECRSGDPTFEVCATGVSLCR